MIIEVMHVKFMKIKIGMAVKGNIKKIIKVNIIDLLLINKRKKSRD